MGTVLPGSANIRMTLDEPQQSGNPKRQHFLKWWIYLFLHNEGWNYEYSDPQLISKYFLIIINALNRTYLVLVGKSTQSM